MFDTHDFWELALLQPLRNFLLHCHGFYYSTLLSGTTNLKMLQLINTTFHESGVLSS
jgi:hypothetical protein